MKFILPLLFCLVAASAGAQNYPYRFTVDNIMQARDTCYYSECVKQGHFTICAGYNYCGKCGLADIGDTLIIDSPDCTRTIRPKRLAWAIEFTADTVIVGDSIAKYFRQNKKIRIVNH